MHMCHDACTTTSISGFFSDFTDLKFFPEAEVSPYNKNDQISTNNVEQFNK